MCFPRPKGYLASMYLSSIYIYSTNTNTCQRIQGVVKSQIIADNAYEIFAEENTRVLTIETVVVLSIKIYLRMLPSLSFYAAYVLQGAQLNHMYTVRSSTQL